MNIEYEATYYDVSHDILRGKIKTLGGVCTQERTLMKRVIFKYPDDRKEKSYFRVRDEGNKITCTYKRLSDGETTIESMQEVETEVSDFDATKKILELSGLLHKAYQESYRETWKIGDDIYFMLDRWPGIKDFIEIEGKNEAIVKQYSEKLGFNYSDAIFGAVDELYHIEHGISHDFTNSCAEISFENPLNSESTL